MKTIFALSLIAAAFAFVPAADATTCDPVPGMPEACAASYAYGTCDNGYNGNYVYAYNYDANGYTYVGAGTGCSGYPGYYSSEWVGAGATSCDASWSCDYAGANWYGYDSVWGSGCYSDYYTYVDGQYSYDTLPVCDAAGSPPAIPALLP